MINIYNTKIYLYNFIEDFLILINYTNYCDLKKNPYDNKVFLIQINIQNIFKKNRNI